MPSPYEIKKEYPSMKEEEKALFKCFIDNDAHPFHSVKSSSNINRALMKGKYIEDPMHKKKLLAKDRVIKDNIREAERRKLAQE